MTNDPDATPIISRAYEYTSFVCSPTDVGDMLNEEAEVGWRLCTSQIVGEDEVLCILERDYVAPLLPEDDDECGDGEET